MKNGNRWGPEEITILAAHNGRLRDAVVALAQAGYSRSVSAVTTKMQNLRASGRMEQTHQSRAYGVLSSKIEAALERRGAMTRDELCKALGQDRRTVAGALKRLRDTGRVHIAEWRRHATGQREYPRPVYAAGPGIDKPKPPPIPKSEINRRFRASRRPRPASVFELALTPRKIASARRAAATKEQ